MTNISKKNGGVFDISITPNLENIALNNINFSNILHTALSEQLKV